MSQRLIDILEAAEFIREKSGIEAFQSGIILGSGLGILADRIAQPVAIPYEEIPGFPVSTVDGHSGELITGMLANRMVIAMKGRFHYYEGKTMQEVTLPVYVMAQLGIRELLLTNAAGGVNSHFRPGDLMLITDHINFGFDNPLIGPNEDILGKRFPDTSRTYSLRLRQIALEAAGELGIPLRQGVYLYEKGPSYETPAEVGRAAFAGADAVGMSTVPEAIAAVHCGLEILGISNITNLAAGLSDGDLSHHEVLGTAAATASHFQALICRILEKL